MTTPTLDAGASTDLSDLVEPLKREVAVPGEFANIFPNTADDDLIGSLSDAFGRAQLDGFFGVNVIDVDAATVAPGLSAGGKAVVLLYAAESIVRSQIRNLKTVTKYEAAGVVYDVEQGVNTLVQDLKDIQDRRKSLIATILRLQRSGQAVYVTDAYLIRSQGYLAATGALVSELGFGLYGWEVPGFAGFFGELG